MKYYVIGFITKKNGYHNWKINVAAKNAKEARAIAEEMWEKDSHMFSIYARALKDYEEFSAHTFVQISDDELEQIYHPR